MSKEANIFTQSYHFLLEGFIYFYFILVYVQFTDVPSFSYWGYFFVLFLAMILFSFISFKNIHRISFIFVLGVLFLLFQTMSFPSWISIGYAILLTYRYARLDKRESFHHEGSYFGITSLLAAVIYIFYQNSDLLIVLLLQYVILLLGFFTRHLIETRKAATYISSFGILSGALIGLSLVFFYFYSEIFSRVFGFIWSGILYLSVQIATFISFTIRDIPINPPEVHQEGMEKGIHKTELGESIFEPIEGIASIHLILIILSFFLIIYLGYRIFRGRDGDKDEALQTESLITSDGTKVNTPRFSFQSAVKSLFKKPDHPVRRLVYDFEKRLAKTKFHRRKSETVENWLQRIGAASDLKIYQHVRYGMKTVDETEIELLKEELKSLEEKLKMD